MTSDRLVAETLMLIEQHQRGWGSRQAKICVATLLTVAFYVACWRLAQVDVLVTRRHDLGAPLAGEYVREVRSDESARAGQVDPHAGCTASAIRTGRLSRSDRSAASPITNGARASPVDTGGAVPVLTASTNACHSRT